MWTWVERCWPVRVRAVSGPHHYVPRHRHHAVRHARRAVIKKVAVAGSIVALPMTVRLTCRLVAEWRDDGHDGRREGLPDDSYVRLPPSTFEAPRGTIRVDEP